jgi:hypothetical protein
LKIPFQWYITCPQIFKIEVVKSKKEICSRLVTADQGGKKEPQWENDCGSFLPCFLLVRVA